MKENKIISVAGYGSTGSSAVVNFLEEFNNCHVMGGEFRLVQDPDGLEDLCNNISNSWGWIRSDAYVRRFIKYTDIVGRRITPFRYGEHLNKVFNYNFFKHRNNFIDSIVDTKWKGHWFYHDYHERTLFQTFTENLKRSLSWHFGFSPIWLRRNTRKSNMYFVKSNINIYPLARAFLNDLFNEFNLESEHLVFDQLILPYHREKFDQLFPGFKQIVVDRDPRDVFLDAKDYNAYPITQDINSFISFYKSSRSLKSIDADEFNLFIQFEDLIYKYDQTSKQIQDFLEIDSQKHAKKFSRLDPSKSINNTQTWLKPENNKYLKDIKIIEEKLSGWCYDF